MTLPRNGSNGALPLKPQRNAIDSELSRDSSGRAANARASSTERMKTATDRPDRNEVEGPQHQMPDGGQAIELRYDPAGIVVQQRIGQVADLKCLQGSPQRRGRECPNLAVVILIGGVQRLEGAECLGTMVKERELLKARVERDLQHRDLLEARVMRHARQIDGALGEMAAAELQRTDQRPGRRHGVRRGCLAPGPWREPNGIGPRAQEVVGIRYGRCLIIARPGIEQRRQRAKGQDARLAMSELRQFKPMGGIRSHDALRRAASSRQICGDGPESARQDEIAAAELQSENDSRCYPIQRHLWLATLGQSFQPEHCGWLRTPTALGEPRS